MSDLGEDSLATRLHREDASVLGIVLRLPGGEMALALRKCYGRRLQAADIDDVLSVALARLWWSRKSIDPRRPLGAWFCEIALNVARNLLKARRRLIRRRQVLTDPRELDRLACRERMDAETPEGASDDLPRVLSALHTLPAAYERILLADAADPTGTAPSDVLARELRLSRSTIRQYRRRAPGRVRRILERQERERERERERRTELFRCAV